MLLRRRLHTDLGVRALVFCVFSGSSSRVLVFINSNGLLDLPELYDAQGVCASRGGLEAMTFARCRYLLLGQ